MASAEAGGGIDGCVTPQEAKQILSHLARGSDPNIRVKALDSLAKMQEREEAQRRGEPESTLEEEILALITCLPASGLGAAMAIGGWYDKARDISTFPFLEECAPIVHQNLPAEWARWRNGVKRNDVAEYLDRVVAECKVLGGDDLISACKANAARRLGRDDPRTKETADAT